MAREVESEKTVGFSFEIRQSWLALEQYLARDWVLLWSHQAHIVSVGACSGLVFSVAALLALSHWTVSEVAIASVVGLIATIQIIWVVIWNFAIRRLFRPDNVPELLTSPKITTLLLFSFLVVAGPVYLNYAEPNPLFPKDIFPTALGEGAIFLIMMNVHKGFGHGSSSGIAGFGVVSIFAVVSFALLWANEPTLVFVLLIISFIVMAAKISIGMVRRWRDKQDGVILTSSAIFVPCALLFSITGWKYERLDVVAVLVEPDSKPWLLGWAFFSMVWLDSARWVIARFSILPVRD